MFYIYYGYVSPDNFDASEGPTYCIKEFRTVDEVLAFKKEFEEEYLHDDCSNIIFRVFDGRERTLSPEKVVTKYKLD